HRQAAVRAPKPPTRATTTTAVAAAEAGPALRFAMRRWSSQARTPARIVIGNRYSRSRPPAVGRPAHWATTPITVQAIHAAMTHRKKRRAGGLAVVGPGTFGSEAAATAPARPKGRAK